MRVGGVVYLFGKTKEGWRIACAAALVAVAGLAAQNRPLRDPHPFRSGINVTTIAATVVDQGGRLVGGLPRDAFEVYEDGQAQTITQFTDERVPISLGVLLDISDSMYGRRIEDARVTVDRFLFELLDPADEFFVLGFNHQPHILTPWTQTPGVVRRALDGLRPSGGTAVYDAVLSALPLIESRAKVRAALIIISDGSDTASDAKLGDVRRALLRSDIFVYAIGIDPPGPVPINARVNPTTLREITDDSGGRTEVVRESSELVAATTKIAEELNRQYLIGYSSAHGADGAFHSVRVRVRGLDYRVRARRGYVAAASVPPP